MPSTISAPMTDRDIIRSFFFGAATPPAAGDIHIDTLDSWTNSGLAEVRPTTISWVDGRPGPDN